MKEFTHPDLNAPWSTLVSPVILQMIDPNDGQSPDWQDKARHQYTVVNGVMYTRRLPPQRVGDCWRGEIAPPVWESLAGPVPRQSLLLAWQEWLSGVGAGMPQDLVDTYTVPGLRMGMEGDRLIVDSPGWPQHVPCPDCVGGVVEWWEAGYVPGWRRCQSCLSQWQIMESDPLPTHRWSVAGPMTRWTHHRRQRA